MNVHGQAGVAFVSVLHVLPSRDRGSKADGKLELPGSNQFNTFL